MFKINHENTKIGKREMITFFIMSSFFRAFVINKSLFFFFYKKRV